MIKLVRFLGVGVLLACTAAFADVSESSLYLAKIPLITQHADKAALDLHRGHPVLISMFYGSCPDVCPLLIMGMQNYEKQLDARSKTNLRALVVSFDATRDTPKQLQAIATMHRADEKRWTFASTDDISARKLAALLNIQYRQKPDGVFDHSVEIVLLDAEGRIVTQTSKLNGDQDFIKALKRATSHP